MLPDLGLLVDPKVWLLLLVSRICLVDHGEHAGWLAGLGEGHEEAGCLRGWLEVPEQLVAGEVGTGDGEERAVASGVDLDSAARVGHQLPRQRVEGHQRQPRPPRPAAAPGRRKGTLRRRHRWAKG